MTTHLKDRIYLHFIENKNLHFTAQELGKILQENEKHIKEVLEKMEADSILIQDATIAISPTQKCYTITKEGISKYKKQLP